MSPDDRRSAIVEVTIPLLREHGSGLTTKQVAQAAGIAEGTVFRAFGTKDELVKACATAVFDNSDTIRRLSEIDRDQTLDDRLAAGVAVLQHRLDDIFGLLGTLAASGAFGRHGLRGGPPEDPPAGRGGARTGRARRRGGPSEDDPRHHGVPRSRRMADPEVDAAFVALIGEDAETLRVAPDDLVHILAHLTLSSSHPMFPVRSMTPAEIVSLVLDGTRKAR